MSDDFTFKRENFSIGFDIINFLLFTICSLSILAAYIGQIKIAIIGIGVVVFFKMPFFLRVYKN